MAQTDGFDKDFGYLLPFLDRVAAAASDLGEAAAREELGRLMAEEKARWARIRELLGGGPGRPVPSSAAVEHAPASAAASEREGLFSTRLTVGSLRRSP